jgi:hypothetical protein
VLALLLPATWFWRYPLAGLSEGVLALVVLGAVDRHLSARNGQAFALAVAASLLRPECWLFTGLYALWLVVDSRERVRWVLPSSVLIPALWFLPELCGSGDAWRSGERAQRFGVDAAARAANPALVVMRHAAEQTPKIVLVGIVTALALMMFRRLSRPALHTAVMLAAIGALWILVVACMAQAGVGSGIDRYLVTPVALATVVGGGSLGRVAQMLRRSRLPRTFQVIAALALAGAVAAGVIHLCVPWSETVDSVSLTAAIGDDLERAIIEAGGRTNLTRCGSLYAPYLLVPSAAWRLRRRLQDVTDQARASGVLFRPKTLFLTLPGEPALTFVGASSRRMLASTQYWQVETAGVCAR